MRKISIVLFVIFEFNFLWASGKNSPDYVSTFMDYTINTRFREAEAFLSNRIVEGDSGYQVYFYYASLLNSKMTHYENKNDAGQFLLYIDKVIDKTNRYILESEDVDSSAMADLYFYRGSAYGYLAYFQGQVGDWYTALNNGMQSYDDLQTALSYDSSFYDAYLGIGVYKYWKSAKLNFLLWLPFVEDRRQEGINDIKRAIGNACNSRYLAIHQLVYILTDYGDFDDALRYAQIGVEAYPKSQFMWWAYAHCYYKKHDHLKAIEAYKTLLSFVEEDDQANPMHWVEIHLKLAEVYLRMENRKQADYHCRLVLAKYPEPFPESGEERLKKAIQMLHDINFQESN
ncbi:MAG: hypothetical protein JXR46_00605 [Calditrichaceae bacterium]|nr:hypothetical protein [Calditrichaceae bacterium]MBN2707514.1 hypothetical protein [Calditrichaceae bacterium]RQV95603.1 MAG: hypothetical protein EH224_07010 [Calditrichota bacterium]